MRKLILVSLSFLLFSCTHLTNKEQAELRELKNYGIKENDYQVANPALAGGLNLLPGFGNFYLASGNGADSNHWVFGALNLLTWPFSILWGVPEGFVDANSINKRELIYYYTFDNQGKLELEKIKKENSNKK